MSLLRNKHTRFESRSLAAQCFIFSIYVDIHIIYYNNQKFILYNVIELDVTLSHKCPIVVCWCSDFPNGFWVEWWVVFIQLFSQLQFNLSYDLVKVWSIVCRRTTRRFLIYIYLCRYNNTLIIVYSN